MTDERVVTNDVNDWHRLADQIGDEHKHILQGTLPTPAFRFLLEAKIRDCKSQLTELDLSRDASDFKERYKTIRLQQEMAEELITFVNSL